MSTRNVVQTDAAATDEYGSVPAATRVQAGAAGLPGVPVPRFAESEQRRRWLDASSELVPLLLSSQAGPPHALIAQHAATAASADFAALAVPYGADRVIVTSVAGELTAAMLNRTAPLAGSLAGQAILTGKPSLVTGDRRAAAAAALGAATGPLIVVPLAAGEQVRGALILGRLATSPGFTEADLDMAVSFADHAAVAMELARARTDQITLARVEDHDRIAGDLHDHVISELFALSMAMQGHATRTDDPATADRVNGYVDALDEIIKKIRTSIFGLHQRRQSPAGLRARLMEIIEEHTPQLGFTAGLRFAGPLDPGPDEALAHDILAVTREALSNCARHAHATAVSISLTLQDRLITLGITDNGRGMGTAARSSGLASMRRRAGRHGGTFLLTAPAGGGTRLTWTASVHQSVQKKI
jgi:signal transduction histidine kinase